MKYVIDVARCSDNKLMLTCNDSVGPFPAPKSVVWGHERPVRSHQQWLCARGVCGCVLGLCVKCAKTVFPLQTITCSMTRLRDSGRLVRMHDRSHVAYSISEPGGMRLVLDGVTCMFTNEYDPTQLRTSMSGKLARCGLLSLLLFDFYGTLHTLHKGTGLALVRNGWRGLVYTYAWIGAPACSSAYRWWVFYVMFFLHPSHGAGTLCQTALV